MGFLSFNSRINITPEELSCQNEHGSLWGSSGGGCARLGSAPCSPALCSFDALSWRGRWGQGVDSELYHSLLQILLLVGSEYLMLLSFLCAQLVIFTLRVLTTAFSPCRGEQLFPAVM